MGKDQQAPEARTYPFAKPLESILGRDDVSEDDEDDDEEEGEVDLMDVGAEGLGGEVAGPP